MTEPARILAALGALPKHRGPNAKGWHEACCPGHEDKHASLGWIVHADGHVGVHDQGGCRTEDICKAVGLTLADLFPIAERAQAPSLVQRYVLRNAAGEIVATHVRRELSGGGKEMYWEGGLSGIGTADLPLYGSELVASWPPDAPIFLVEGEKAADALRARNLYALGTVTGASGTPGPLVLAVLAGHPILLWPDADDVGRRHMERIGQLLNGATRWIEPPDGSPKGWDAADMAPSFDFGALIAKARPLSLPADRDTGPKVWTVNELAELPTAEEEFMIAEGILTRGGKMLVYAKSGAGKTTLLDFIAGPLASGRPFLGQYAVDSARRTLIVQGELSVPEMSSHAQMLRSADFTDDGLMFTRATNLRLPAGEELLRDLVIRHEASVLALDPWYRLFSGESSDKPEQVGVVFDVCDRLLEDGLVEAVIVVHHANVSGLRTAGSWLFEGWPSTIIKLEIVPGVPNERILTFEKVRAPSSTLLGKGVAVVLAEAGYRLLAPEETSFGAGVITARLIVKEAGGQLSRKEVIKRLQGRLNIRERQANKYLGEAYQAGYLRKVRAGAEVLYQLDDEPE